MCDLKAIATATDLRPVYVPGTDITRIRSSQYCAVCCTLDTGSLRLRLRLRRFITTASQQDEFEEVSGSTLNGRSEHFGTSTVYELEKSSSNPTRLLRRMRYPDDSLQRILAAP